MRDETAEDVTVPPPVPPADGDAWYAPDVRAQEEVFPGVVATVTEADPGEFRYAVREPALTAGDRTALERVREHFAGANLERPRTREGTLERARKGFEPKYERAVARLVESAPAARRRLTYHALRELRLLGDVTPLALDEAIDVADVSDDRLVVHRTDFAPCETAVDADADHLDRFLAERVDRHEVRFREFSVPVVIYRERLLGADAFDLQYAVLEPPLLPGDRSVIEACKEHVWETSVDGVVGGGDGWQADGTVRDRATVVRERARRFIGRELAARNADVWREALAYRVKSALAEWGVRPPPVDDRFAADRRADLLYYVMRDFVGDGELTVPIRDPGLEDVEANRVGERIKVVPRHPEANRRIPSNLTFEDERRFENLVTQLAARDGVELNASNPTAKVNLEFPEAGADTTIRCALALPVVSEDGPHVSIRKQSPQALTPTDLVRTDSVPTELVALLWMAYEHHGVVLFSGPTGVGKTTLLNAHMPFVPYHDRPVSIDEGSREVRLPQETGVSLSTRDHQDPYKAVTMADLMTEANYLNPDVEVIAEINTSASFQTFAEAVQTGHGVLGTTHAADVPTFVNRAIEQGVPAYLLSEVDLVVFPRHVDGDRFVGRVVEFVDAGDAGPATRTVERPETTVHYDVVAERTTEGSFTVPGSDPGDLALFGRLAARENRDPAAVAREFQRKHRYVQYIVREGVDDVEDLFAFLSDLRTDEAATVERIQTDRS
ncbi:MAG: type II/IV secretion system ATPase subunit [Halobacteriaceae archaeon]